MMREEAVKARVSAQGKQSGTGMMLATGVKATVSAQGKQSGTGIIWLEEPLAKARGRRSRATRMDFFMMTFLYAEI
jgi:hypothetical protein